MSSAHDGRALPHWWLCSVHKSAIVHRLVRGLPVSAMPTWWKEKSYDDRMRIIHHLVASGELQDGHYFNLTGHHYTPRSGTNTGRMVMSSLEIANLQEYKRYDQRDDHIDAFLHGNWVIDQLQNKARVHRELVTQMHESPNGGKRILPSVYTKLTTHWLQRSGEFIEPRCMNLHHLKCTLALLNESHGNFVARATLLAGKVHAHLECEPVVRSHMEAACLELQKLDVSKLYPIFDLLAKEYELKLKTPPPPPVEDLWLNVDPGNQLEWDDK